MKINKKHFRVTIFGSARLKPNDPEYQQIYSLARMIAQENYDIVTGGGPGIMEAANKGHKEGRKRSDLNSYGLTIELPREQMSNKHLDIQKDFKRFSNRLEGFMELSNAVIIAPGGVGTMLELFYTWQLVQVKHIKPIPIIFMSNMWKGLVEWIEKGPLKKRLISPDEMNPLFLAKNCTEVIKILRKVKKEHDNGSSNFCTKFKHYKMD